MITWWRAGSGPPPRGLPAVAALPRQLRRRPQEAAAHQRSQRRRDPRVVAVLDGSLMEELGGDGPDTLTGYRSMLHGTRPDASGYAPEHAEITALVESVHGWVGQGR